MPTDPPPGCCTTRTNAINAFIAASLARGHTDPEVAAKLVEDAEAGRDVDLVATMNDRGRRDMRQRAKSRMSHSPMRKTAPRRTAERRPARASSTTRRSSGARSTRASSSSSSADAPPGDPPPPSLPPGRSSGLHKCGDDLRNCSERLDYMAARLEDVENEIALLVGGAQ